jgi:hypothetical protein
MNDLVQRDDQGPVYLAGRQAGEVEDALARLRAMAGPQEPVEATGRHGDERPPAPASSAPDPAVRIGGMFGPVGAALAPVTGAIGREISDGPPVTTKPGDGIGNRIMGGLGTVSRNAGDAFGQLFLGGPLDAVRQLFLAADDLMNWATGQKPPEGQPRPADWAGHPGAAIADLVPSYPPPDTSAGRVAHEIGQFLAGFLGGSKVIKGVAGAAKTIPGQAGQAMTAGAMADFFAMDANRARLADLWQQAGLPANALTDYLATDPTDDAATARLKSTIEGAGLGVVAEGVLAAARGFRAMRAAGPDVAEAARRDAQAALEREGQELLARETAARLGDAAEDAVLTSRRPFERRAAAEVATGDMGVPDAVAARGAAGAADIGVPPPTARNTEASRAAGDVGPLYVNWAKVNAPQDVQEVMHDMASAFRGDVNAAARGVQTNEATQALAADLGLTVDDLLARRPGEPWNAETAFAARQVWAQSAEKLTALARAAAMPTANDADQFAFRRMLSLHYAIQAEVLAARRETARALQSWSIPAGSGVEQAKAIQQALEQAGGPAASAAIARRLAALADGGASAAELGRFAAKGWAARSADAVHEVWINGLLSSPKTHAVNVTSNTFNLGLQVLERGVTARWSGAVEPGEASAMLYGVLTSWKDAFRLAGHTWRDGSEQVGQMIGKVDLPHERAVSSRAFGLDPSGALGWSMDLLGHSIVNVPSRALQAEDAFFKTLGYRAELHAGALRMARQAEVEAGTHPVGSQAFADAVAARVGQLTADPPEALRLMASDFALYTTFNREAGPIAKSLIALRASDSAVFSKFIAVTMPFIRTPANILNYSFERTPLAPLVRQWREDVAAGGARRDLALSRMALGTAAMAVAFDLADRGYITGSMSGDTKAGNAESLRNQGAQPYAMRVGDQWVSYNRLDPFGFTLGFAADFADMLRRRDVTPEDFDDVSQLVAEGAAVIAKSAVNKTWMQGVAGAIEALDDPNRNAGRFMQQLAGSLVPAVINQTEQAISPAGSERHSVADAVLARIPVLADSLPPLRTRWGEVVTSDRMPLPGSTVRGVVDAFSPFRVTDVRAAPVDAELQRLSVDLERPGKSVDFGGATVNLRAYPQAYDDYVRLAGNDWKNPATGKGLHDTLAEMVGGQGPMAEAYRMASDGRDGGKAQLIKQLAQLHRAGARDALLRLHPDLADVVAERQQHRIEVRQPVLDGAR